MIHAGLRADGEEEQRPRYHGFWRLAITGFATSIDAMVVGASLAFINANIFTTAAAIGLSTFVMVTLGAASTRQHELPG